MMRADLASTSRPADVSISQFIDLSATPWRRIVLSARDDVWCLVDAVDYEWLLAWKWNVSWGSRTPWQHYAKRNVGPDRATLRMHREIMIVTDPRSEAFMAGHHVDHGNRQSLDNRRANLAWKTHQQNAANSGPRSSIPSLDAILLGLMREHGFVIPQEVPF